MKEFSNDRNVGISVTAVSGEKGLNNLCKIIFQLQDLAPRFIEYQIDMKLSFSYLDAFKPTKRINSKSMYYDLSVFSWNYAALHSQIGSRVDRSTDEGIRTANKHFQQAAGALTLIKHNYLQRLDTDTYGPINIAVLNMMIELMLGEYLCMLGYIYIICICIDIYL